MPEVKGPPYTILLALGVVLGREVPLVICCCLSAWAWGALLAQVTSSSPGFTSDLAESWPMPLKQAMQGILNGSGSWLLPLPMLSLPGPWAQPWAAPAFIPLPTAWYKLPWTRTCRHAAGGPEGGSTDTGCWLPVFFPRAGGCLEGSHSLNQEAQGRA